MTQPSHQPANRLADAHSLYLRQHAHNPVDWYPWGPEALQRAQREDKPILLSIGYAACHWCHVMAHESFEDPDVAALMNRSFINIKVDREERPDLDAIYMQALQAMTGSGGWPMTLFLNPAGEPFFAGTYFPPQPRHGMPSFTQLLAAIAQAWRERREELDETGRRLRFSLLKDEVGDPGSQAQSLDPSLLTQALQGILRQYDRQLGGFGRAPKFPQPLALDFVLSQIISGGPDAPLVEAAGALGHTLHAIALGGIYDQLGGGFHRYSTDAHWLVPHFEKMLYDNALLARTYLHAWQEWGSPLYRRVVEETLDFSMRELADPQGGFYASLDADSEGEEGRFYTWTWEALNTVLGDGTQAFAAAYGMRPEGNAAAMGPGMNIPHLPQPSPLNLNQPDPAADWAKARAQLLERREQRVRPARDEKILAEWNGYMLAALAEAGFALERPDYLAFAHKTAQRILGQMLSRDSHGRLRLARVLGGRSADGFLEDYASLGLALLSLYQVSFDPSYLQTSFDLAESILAYFGDPEGPGFFQTAADAEELIARHRDSMDNAVPSGSNMAALLLLRLARLSDNSAWRERAEAALAALGGTPAHYGQAFGLALQAAHEALFPGPELVLSGNPRSPEFAALHAQLRPHYIPGGLVFAAETELRGLQLPLVEGRRGQKPAVYICQNYTCQPPITDPQALQLALTRL